MNFPIYLFCLLSTVFAHSTFPQQQMSIEIPYSPEIKEWHFHVYFIPREQPFAWELRNRLIEAVKNKEFVSIFNGINSTIVPGVEEGNIPKFNVNPIGPHIVGSYEVWVPTQHFSAVLSWMTLNRGPLSVLIHPLTRYEILDHTDRSMWMGTPYRLDLTRLTADLGEAPLQYPELHLGYSTQNK